MRIAIFPGSFDPFTVGHADIVNRSLSLFDKVVIGIGKNSLKQSIFPVENRLQHIRKVFKDEPRVAVEIYTGLTVDFAREQNAQFILRGIRCVADFEYERNMAEANKQLAGVETIILYTRPEYAHISSTLVRDLYQHGQDITPYLA
ncbi:MAG: pantetheine-phosphate adenylyltransferase [Paludibacteraceae bacterium]|nr:pantetheine-phosphate adenylyltransferase [Paludibacteraceae bacterium]